MSPGGEEGAFRRRRLSQHQPWRGWGGAGLRRWPVERLLPGRARAYLGGVLPGGRRETRWALGLLVGG